MAETQYHVDAIFQLRELLDDLFAARIRVWIGTDQFWYWEEGNPSARTAPDIMVVFGIPREPLRRSFLSWREKAIPSFICEFSSEHTWENHLSWKRNTYERLGVKEYFLFDPEYHYLRPALQGFRLASGRYRRSR